MPISSLEKRRAAGRRYYYSHKKQYRDYRRKQRASRRKLVQSFKEKPCADCGFEYPYYVMDFDHVRGKKEFLISAMASMKIKYNGGKNGYRNGVHASGGTVGIERLKAEIAKCDVVCANCHRERTHKRRLKAQREKSRA